MSIAAKQTLLQNLQMQLSSTLTVDNLNVVIDTLTEQLDQFDVESVNLDSQDLDSNDLLNAFLDTKMIEGRSPQTIERYKYIVTKMLEQMNVQIRQITVFHLRSYLMKQKVLGKSDRTLEGEREVFSAFFGWLYKESLLKTNPAANLSPIKCPKKVRLPYSEVDLEKLKEACICSRDKAIISFLFSTGCRISEVCQLNREDVDLTNKECTVLGKGNKERTVFINDVTVMLIKRYMYERMDEYPSLFAGKGSERMTPGGVRAMLKRLEEKSGVEHVHPHRFRRTLATELIDHGMPIQEVASILGHDKLDTTMTYVYVSKSNVRSSYNKYM